MHLRCLIAALSATDPSLSVVYFLQKPYEICPVDFHAKLKVNGNLHMFRHTLLPDSFTQECPSQPCLRFWATEAYQPRSTFTLTFWWST